jgi:hypothetical protein
MNGLECLERIDEVEDMPSISRPFRRICGFLHFAGSKHQGAAEDSSSGSQAGATVVSLENAEMSAR